MSWFQALLMSGNGISYYVSESGTGNGRSPLTPMSPADFLLLEGTINDNDQVFFLAGDEF